MIMSRQKIIDVVQWILIASLSILLLIGFIRQNESLTKNAEFDKNNTYVKIYESQSISKLKKENKELYDSIKTLKDVESAVEIKYRYRYKTDTVFVPKKDGGKITIDKDSLYKFTSDNDTVNYELDVKAKGLEWYTMNFTINDKFTLVNRNDGNQNETNIYHSPNVSIDGTTMYHVNGKSNKWYNRFAVGPQVGFGINNDGQFGTYVGVGVTFNLLGK